MAAEHGQRARSPGTARRAGARARAKAVRIGRLARHLRHTRSRVRPDRVVYPGLVELHVDPDDDRAQWVLSHRGVTQSAVTGTWAALSSRLEPTLALDIGANYGEVSLLGRYRPGHRLLLFEPNPRVLAPLRRSVASHADRDRITVIPAAVGRCAGRAQLAVDLGYSGTSTLRGGQNRDEGQPGPATFTDVPVVTVDEAVEDADADPTSILFKMDVEGYEGQVLAGMTKVLGGARRYAGIVEFDRNYLDEVEPDHADDTARRLLELGPCWYLVDHRLQPWTTPAELPDHTDVVVCSEQAIAHELVMPAWVRTR